MDKETAKYLVTYFFRLLPDEEKLAWKHHSSLLKLESNDNPKAMEVYKRKGWITDEKKILDILIEGYDKFEERTAEKILKKYPDKIFLNNCPNCNKLARTPYAKQCRFCGCDWH